MNPSSTVLYGPNLIPTESWLAQTLFHAESVVSLAPHGFLEPEELKPLADRGWWRSVSVEESFNDPGELDRLIDESINVAREHAPSVRKSLAPTDRVLLGKLPAVLEGHLLQAGVLERIGADPSRLQSRDPLLIPTMIELAGKSVAEQQGWRQDFTNTNRTDVALAPLSGKSDPAIAITISALPALKKGTPLSAVLDFRDHHQDLFDDYLRHLRRVEERAAELEELGDTDEAVRSLEDAVRELQRAMTLRRLPLRKQARYLVVRHGGSRASAVAASIGLVDVASQIANIGSTSTQIAALGALGALTVAGVRVRQQWKGAAYLTRAAREGLLA